MADKDLADALAQVDVAVSPVEKFREYLATIGMRLTTERRTVVETVFSSHEHFDAEELVVGIAARGVSRSTGYRTLSLMENAGLIRKVARANERDVYEHDYGYPQHDHLICKQCGSLTEFPNDQVAALVAEIAESYGFRIESHRLEAYGVCADCCRPSKRRPSKLDML